MPYIAKKGLPFDYRGAVKVEDCKSSAEVMEKAGLNWEVAKCEVYSKFPVEEDVMNHQDIYKDHHFMGHDENLAPALYAKIPNGYATYRKDYGIPLGIVKERYTPVQNSEAFSFFDDAIGKNAAIWQTAGFFGMGERIFVSAKLPNTITVKGDPVDSYLVFTNSHDGSSGVKILFTPIRIVCLNTLNAAIRTTSNYVTFRHTKSVHQSISTAKEILGICDVISENLKEAYTEMAKITIKDDKFQELVGQLVLSQGELDKLKEGGYTIKSIFNRNYNAIEYADISTQKFKAMTNIEYYYHNGIGQKEIEGTGWGVYNALTGYYSNMENNEGTKRLDTLLYGDRARKIQLFGETILAQAI